jgi:hypothetical protein
VPNSKPQPEGSLVKARAWRWQPVLENGEYGTLAGLSAAERISRSYICRALRLTLLAPDIIERVMDGGRRPGSHDFWTRFRSSGRSSASSS